MDHAGKSEEEGDCGGRLFLERSWPADERTAPKIKSQEKVRIPRNADPDALPDFTGFVVTVSEPQRTFAAKIDCIEATINPQRRGESSWSSRQVTQALDAAISPHDRDAFEWFERPDQDAGSDPGHLARDIQHVRGAVGEINIGVPRFEKQRTITPSHPPVGVPGGVADDISLGLNNTTAGDAFRQLPHQHRANEIAGERDRINRQLRASERQTATPTRVRFQGISSTHCAREGPGSKGSPKYWVSRATFPSRNSMMLTV